MKQTLVFKRPATVDEIITQLHGVKQDSSDRHPYHFCECSECGRTYILRSDNIRTKKCRCQGGK